MPRIEVIIILNNISHRFLLHIAKTIYQILLANQPKEIGFQIVSRYNSIVHRLFVLNTNVIEFVIIEVVRTTNFVV